MQYNCYLDSYFLGNTEFVLGPYSITILAGSTYKDFDVPVNDDYLCESNKTIPLFISTSSLPDRVSLGDPSEATVIIIDDDSKF